ncbi:MAG TPA: Rid family hydrolase, partial [bacterium]|nr:Rid family hydrolase [bacterium]
KLSLKVPGIPTSIRISHFHGKNGTDEYHITICPYKLAELKTQINWLYQTYIKTLDFIGLDLTTSVFKRFFCSDLANQSETIERSPFFSENQHIPCAISLISQPPGHYAKVSLWAYHIKHNKTIDKTMDGKSLILKCGSLTHYWTSGITFPEGKNTYEQTIGLLEKYNNFLNKYGMTLKDNVIRTWFFVQNIDVNYHPFVIARKEFYEKNGLTKNTHFIASTGIQGSSKEIAARVVMDAYAISGITQEQIKFLSVPEYMSPTYIYGVTFERGTAIHYQDRQHIFISGTASIDNQGNILYQGDVIRQLDRTITNIEALLRSAGATLKDMAIVIAYVRDPSDHNTVKKILKKRIGNTPVIIAYAPVCRPGWLVEIEGIAIL